MLQNKIMKLICIAFLLLGVISNAQTKIIAPHPETGREMFYFSEGLYKDYEIIRNYGSNRIHKKLKKGDKTVEILEHIHGIQVSEYDSHTHIKYVFAYNKVWLNIYFFMLLTLVFGKNMIQMVIL